MSGSWHPGFAFLVPFVSPYHALSSLLTPTPRPGLFPTERCFHSMDDDDILLAMYLTNFCRATNLATSRIDRPLALDISCSNVFEPRFYILPISSQSAIIERP